MDHPVSFFSLSRICRFPCVSRCVPFWSAFCVHKKLMYCDSITHFSSAFHRDWWLVESNGSMKSTVATHICIPTFSVQTICMLQNDPAFGMNLVAHGQVCRKICCWVWRTVCTALADRKSGGNFRLLPHFLLCTSLLYVFSPHVSGVQSSCFITSLKICLRRFVPCLDVFISDSIAVTCLSSWWRYQWLSAVRLVWILEFHFSRHRYGFLFRCSLLFPMAKVLHFFSKLIFYIKLAVEEIHRRYWKFLSLM